MMIDQERVGNRHSVVFYCPKCNKVFSDIGIGQYYGIRVQDEYDKDEEKFLDMLDMIDCPFCHEHLELLDRRISNTVVMINNTGYFKTTNSCDGHLWFTEDGMWNSSDPYVEFEVVWDKWDLNTALISNMQLLLGKTLLAADGKELDIRYDVEKVKEKATSTGNLELTWVPCRRFRIYPNFKFFNFENTDRLADRFNAVCDKYHKDIHAFAKRLRAI